jgi:hypothetical protein
MNTSECVLSILPGANDEDRLAVVLVRARDGSSVISLRQQTWAEGIGWYDQKCLDLEPGQLRGLRAALGWGGQTKPDRTEMPAILSFPGSARVESA